MSSSAARQILRRESVGLCAICGRGVSKFEATGLEGGYRFSVKSVCHGEEEALILSARQVVRAAIRGMFPPFLATATKRRLKAWHLLPMEQREIREALAELCDGEMTYLDGDLETIARSDGMPRAAIILRQRIKKEEKRRQLKLSEEELARRRADIERLRGPQPNIPWQTAKEERREKEAAFVGLLLARQDDDPPDPTPTPPTRQQPQNIEPPKVYEPGRRRIVVADD